MRDKVNVLYYAETFVDQMTLKKAILFFDKIHCMDRPSFTFDGGMGSTGMALRCANSSTCFGETTFPSPCTTLQWDGSVVNSCSGSLLT